MKYQIIGKNIEVTEGISSAIKRKVAKMDKYFANPDMVGHTGNLDAAIKAVEAVDKCVGKIMDAINRI